MENLMRTSKPLITCVALLAALALVLSAQAAGIVGSKHDMNAVFGPDTIQNNEVCLPCHTAHNPAEPTLTRLWNKQMSTQTYTMYGTGTKYLSELDEGSRKCLSCHDGTVAVDSYGTPSGVRTGTKTLGVDNAIDGDGNATLSTAGYVIGKDGSLKHDHPVGVEYPTTSIGTRWVDPATWSGLQDADGNTIHQVGGGMKLTEIGGKKYVSCGTCHTAHTPTYHFLKMSNAKSQLCLS